MSSDSDSQYFKLNEPDILSKAPVKLFRQHREHEETDYEGLADLDESLRSAQPDVHILFQHCTPDTSLVRGAPKSDQLLFVSDFRAANPDLIRQPQVWTDEMQELWGDIVQAEGTAYDTLILAASRRAIAMNGSQFLEPGIRKAEGWEDGRRDSASKEQLKYKQHAAVEAARHEAEKKEAGRLKFQPHHPERTQCHLQTQEAQQEETERTDGLNPLTKESKEIDALHEAISAAILRYVLGLNPPPVLGTPLLSKSVAFAKPKLPEEIRCLKHPEHISPPLHSALKTTRKLHRPYCTSTMTDSPPGTERITSNFSDESFRRMEMAIFRLGGGVRLSEDTLAGLVSELEKLGGSKEDINKAIRWTSKYKNSPFSPQHSKCSAVKSPCCSSKGRVTVVAADELVDGVHGREGDTEDDGYDEDYKEYKEEDDEEYQYEENYEEISDGDVPAVSPTPPKPSRRALKLAVVAGKTAEEVMAEIVAGARLAAAEGDYKAAGAVDTVRRSIKPREGGGAGKSTKEMKGKGAAVPKYAPVNPSRSRSRKSRARDVQSDEEWDDYITSGSLAPPRSGRRSVKLGSKGMTLEQQMQEIAAQAEREATRSRNGVSSKRSKF
jgi:hypothetical protein